MNLHTGPMLQATTDGPEMSPLIRYVLRGLDNCWLEEHGRWSHIYHLDGREQPNQSIPESDVFYTLNVLLGLSRLRGVEAASLPDLRDVLDRNARMLLRLPVRKYAYGMALWASAELGRELPPEVLAHIKADIADRSTWSGFRAQDLGMILTGVVAQARQSPAEWKGLAHDLFRCLSQGYVTDSGLFCDGARGLRRRLATFATNTYLTIACYAYYEQFGDERALRYADACARKLISLQGAHGEWPWFYDAQAGSVLDFYEVYSVHQDGMAPAFLEFAERNGLGAVATDAMRKGFRWIYGDNQLRQSMLVPELGLIYRSHVRPGEMSGKVRRAGRVMLNSLLGRTSGPISPELIELRKECRSYHLGWVVWSFAQRDDLRDLTHHPSLTVGCGDEQRPVASPDVVSESSRAKRFG